MATIRVGIGGAYRFLGALAGLSPRARRITSYWIDMMCPMDWVQYVPL